MTIQTITLNDLTPPAANPRTVIDADGIEGLAASIKADGLLQNLVVRKKGRKFEIVSGERRYRALMLLKERGDITGDHPIPVDIRAKLSAEDALRLATVENVQREALPPMDEAEAFARMVNDGAEIADVAAKAGLSEITVKRRLALAALCAAAKEAVRTGEVSLSVAEAMTIGTAAQQQEVLEHLNAGEFYTADDIRAWLAGGKPSVAMAVFPPERYTGTFTRDLFGDDDTTYFDDAEQFRALQKQAVAELAEKHRQSAAWVEVIEAAHVPWWQYREADAQNAPGGVVILHAPTGAVEVREGLVKAKLAESVVAATAPAAPKAKPEYPAALVRHMAAHKSLAVMATLLTNPRKAKEVAVIQMMNALDRAGRVKLDPHPALGLAAEMKDTPRDYQTIENLALDFTRLLPAEGVEADAYRYPTKGDWEWLLRTRKDAGTLYRALGKLTDTDLDKLHLFLTVLTFGQGDLEQHDTGDSLFNAVAADLGINMADHWRPDAAFLSRRTTAQLGEIAKESAALPRLGLLKDYKKKALVEALARHFQRTDNAQERTWLPGAMRFPAVTADAPPVEACAEGAEVEVYEVQRA